MLPKTKQRLACTALNQFYGTESAGRNITKTTHTLQEERQESDKKHQED